jgi:protein-tyrosine phosphatase
MTSSSPPPASPARPERHIRLAGTRNLRDIGGYPAGAGRRTRWRTLFRSDALDQLPVASQTALLELGLRLAIDLRWPDEAEARPSVFRNSAAVRYVNLPVRNELPPPSADIHALYREILDRRGAQLAEIARHLLAPGGLPALVGCAAGVDRTGLAVALILSAIGVPGDVVAADYALSAATFASDGRGSGLGDWRSGPVTIDCRPEYMLAALDHLDRRHGGVAALYARHGLAAADLDRLRELLTAPEPEP